MLDNFLIILLVVIVPGYMFGRSLAGRGKSAPARVGRYIRSIVISLGLVTMLTIDWINAGRSPAALGLLRGDQDKNRVASRKDVPGR